MLYWCAAVAGNDHLLASIHASCGVAITGVKYRTGEHWAIRACQPHPLLTKYDESTLTARVEVCPLLLSGQG